ncbi:hypothetical protein BDN72DRAFT_880721 [Pluteus cervinus]|uniref:Uncharacterized protein n=1 Tax=Pluteus cervinus TaxID=181527 RepID=A0ACD3AKK8_9AGAR|nr:hypothetical protein BDN72DRAFT_880721 [Pluteus cervinus]
MTDPVFPREIENTIFTYALALKAKDESALDLMLVAQRFHTWLFPELIRTVVVQPNRGGYPSRWDISTIEKYGIHVRNLFLWTRGSPSPTRFLAHCPNVTNLLLWTDEKDFPIDQLGQLRLTHLSVELSIIPHMTPEVTELFHKITHLEEIGRLTSERDLERLKELTSITHLAIPAKSRQDLLPRLFGHHPTLEVLIVLDDDGPLDEPLHVDAAFDSRVDDPKIVRMFFELERLVEDWLLEVEMGQGIWGIADNAVQERKELRDAVRRR